MKWWNNFGEAGGDPRSHAQADFPTGWAVHALSAWVIGWHARESPPPFFPIVLTLKEKCSNLGCTCYSEPNYANDQPSQYNVDRLSAKKMQADIGLYMGIECAHFFA